MFARITHPGTQARRLALLGAALLFACAGLAQAQSAGDLPPGSASSTYSSPSPVLVASGSAPPSQWARIVVAVQLQGGNDGLNTVIPYADPLYYKLRPTLAIPKAKVLPLSPTMGLNSELAPLMSDWKQGDLAIILGVGYPHPDRSHFRSTDIWETGSGSDEVLNTGWIERMLAAANPPSALIADGAVIGGLGLGPLRGPALRTISMNDPAQFIAAAKNISAIGSPTAPGGPLSPEGGLLSPPSGAAMLARPKGQQAAMALPSSQPSPLAFLETVQDNLVEAAQRLELLKSQEPHLKTVFPKTRFGDAMHNAAELIAMGAAIPVIKVQLGGFDTHANELARQDAVLADLGTSLEAFRAAMVELGKWNDVLVMTYSEFGRRVMENGSGGTDHGTAEPVLLLGGMVKGGFYGKEPSLSDLTSARNGDLKYTTDYRSLYVTIGTEWWDIPAAKIRAGLFPGVSIGSLTDFPIIRAGS